MFADQSAARLFLVGPILDADGVAVTAAKTATDVLEVVKNGVSGAPDAQDTMAHSATGHYIVTTDGGDFDTLGEVTFLLNDGTNAMQPVTFQVVPANVYDSLVLGSDNLQTDAIQFSGSATAADNAETFWADGTAAGNILLMYDGTGFEGGTTKLGIDMVSIHGTALTETPGQLAGAFKKFFDVAAPTATALSLPDAAAAAVGGLYTRGTGAGQINQTTNGQVDVTTVSAVAGWVQDMFTVDSTDVSGDEVAGSLILETAKVVWDRILSGATHNINTSAGKRVRNIQDFGIYDMASVWVDEAAGTSSGTTDGEDGTVVNRSDDFDNAQTIAASVGLDSIHIQNGNTITLAATLNGYNIWGGAANVAGEWTLALGTQDIGTTTFYGAIVSGVGTGTSPHFHHCVIGTTTLPPSKLIDCLFTTTLTVGSAGAMRIINGRSGVAGAGAPVIDMGAGVGASTLELRDWRGGITLNNLAAGDVVTLDGIFGTIALNGADAAVEIRGTWKAVTNNLTGSPTVTKSGVEGTDLADVLVDTGEIGTAGAGLTNINLPNQTMDIVGSITGNLSGSVGSVTGAVGSVTGNVGGNVTGSIGSLATQAKADVNAEVLDVIATDTFGEAAQGAPGATISLKDKIGYLYTFQRNKSTQTATEKKIYADDGTTVNHKATVSDDATTFTSGELGTGA